MSENTREAIEKEKEIIKEKGEELIVYFDDDRKSNEEVSSIEYDFDNMLKNASMLKFYLKSYYKSNYKYGRDTSAIYYRFQRGDYDFNPVFMATYTVRELLRDLIVALWEAKRWENARLKEHLLSWEIYYDSQKWEYGIRIIKDFSQDGNYQEGDWCIRAFEQYYNNDSRKDENKRHDLKFLKQEVMKIWDVLNNVWARMRDKT